MAFIISALPEKQFSKLSNLTDVQLATQGIKTITVDANPGYPCRVSLSDAEMGERIYLLNYCHHDHNTPYRATHAIYVRENVRQAKPAIDFIPNSIKSRLISVRGFNRAHDMVEADIAEGEKLCAVINTMLENKDIAYLHLHNAKQGCYAAKVCRA